MGATDILQMPTTERGKGMLKGAFLGMSLPTLILIIVTVRQMGEDHTVMRQDSGAPVEVQERLHPIVRRPAAARTVFSNGANRTVRFNANNPYLRGNTAPSLQQQRLRAYFNNTNQQRLAKPWELREAKNAKQMSKQARESAAKALAAARDQGSVPPGSLLPPATYAKIAKAAKAKKVFESSTPGFAPGEAVKPKAGTEYKTFKSFKSAVGKKCATLVAFYNSEDAAMSREFAATWNALATNEATKYATGYVDTRTAAGLEIAVNASVIVTADSNATAVGTPAILFYEAQNAFSAPYAKVVYKNAAENGVKALRAGKVLNTMRAGMFHPALAASAAATLNAPPTPEESVAAVAKKLLSLAENHKLGLSKEGCFLKHKTTKAFDRAEAAHKEAKAAKVAAKNATSPFPLGRAPPRAPKPPKKTPKKAPTKTPATPATQRLV